MLEGQVDAPFHQSHNIQHLLGNEIACGQQLVLIEKNSLCVAKRLASYSC